MVDPVGRTENLDKEMDRFEVGELIVVRVDADAEEETSVSSVDDLVVSELKAVSGVLLVLVTRVYQGRRKGDRRGRG
jgi:hypothetical protein